MQESFQKALRSLETGCDGWSLPRKWKRMDNQQLVYNLRVPNPERVLVIKQVRVLPSCYMRARELPCVAVQPQGEDRSEMLFVAHHVTSRSSCQRYKSHASAVICWRPRGTAAGAVTRPCLLLALTRHLRTQAFEDGFSQEDIFEYTKIDPWFVAQFWEMHQAESWLKTQQLGDISAFDMLQAKKRGFSDSQIARFTGMLLHACPSSLRT